MNKQTNKHSLLVGVHEINKLKLHKEQETQVPPQFNW